MAGGRDWLRILYRAAFIFIVFVHPITARWTLQDLGFYYGAFAIIGASAWWTHAHLRRPQRSYAQSMLASIALLVLMFEGLLQGSILAWLFWGGATCLLAVWAFFYERSEPLV